MVEGATRIEIGDIVESPSDDPIQVGALAAHVSELLGQWVMGQGVHPQERDLVVTDASDPERLSAQVIVQIELPWIERISLLEEPSLQNRLQRLIDHLAVALATQSMQVDITAKVTAAMDKSQREYHLKEQLKVIREELGDAVGADADAFEERIRAAGLPEAALDEVLREVERMRRIPSESAEHTIIRTWLETLCDVPWTTSTPDTTDLKHAQLVLDEDHYGLDKVKERILEYLAVRQLNPESSGAILCFAGPPGVGKTSLGRSIARALGREFGRIALGGVRDETEVRGHRRTYIGAMPGRFVRAMVRAKTRNPVIVLDEIDKVGTDVHRGDPASALLEVLDPAQNVAFEDHYLDVPVDLSQVLFIATANLIDPIPAALRDRLEIIEIPGYIEEDKVKIAERHLLPKMAIDHGLTNTQISINRPALRKSIRDYTREAGVRDLHRTLANIHRKVARAVVEGRDRGVRVTEKSLRRYLGPPRFFQEVVERVDQPGVVVGLAWTAAGGEILFIEAIRMAGKPSLKLTGSLGNVMKESAEAAMSWLRSHASDYGVAPEDFEHAFHLHVPAGAIPKDGPSAGVTMATALASLVTGRSVRARCAMTGEITLRGKVLPVGGVKEKVLAARRAGVTMILLPKHNENDLEDIPSILRRDLEFHFVETIEEVLALALVDTPK